MGRAKYKKLSDLYTRGVEVVFEDDTVMWLQVMNSFEIEEARRAASIAKARFSLMVSKIGSDEHSQVMANVEGAGAQSAIEDLLLAHRSEHFLKAAQDTQVDSEFKERWEIIERAEEVDALAADDPERKVLEKITEEYFTEVQRRTTAEQDFLRETLERMSHEQLVEEYSEQWISRRGQTRAIAAYNVAEILSVCRVCDAIKVDDKWDHAACDHSQHVFEHVKEIEDLPEPMLTIINEGIESFNMTVRDAKN